jgi:hypothetical protein
MSTCCSIWYGEDDGNSVHFYFEMQEREYGKFPLYLEIESNQKHNAIYERTRSATRYAMCLAITYAPCTILSLGWSSSCLVLDTRIRRLGSLLPRNHSQAVFWLWGVVEAGDLSSVRLE